MLDGLRSARTPPATSPANAAGRSAGRRAGDRGTRPGSVMDLSPLRDLVAALAADWRAAAGGLYFASRERPLLAAAALAGVALVVLRAAAVARAPRRARGGDRAGDPGGDARLAPRLGASRAARAGRRRPAAGAAGAGRALHGAGQPDRVVSRPAHRPDDRRLRQHADGVHARPRSTPAPPPSRPSSPPWRRRSASSSCAAPASTAI